MSQQIVDTGDFIYIWPHYVVHKSGLVCPYLYKYHVTAKKYNSCGKLIHGIDTANFKIIKIRDNYILVEMYCEKYALLTKHVSYVFKSTRDSEFIDADLYGDDVTTVYSHNRKFGKMQLYYITTNKHNTYTVQGKCKYGYIDRNEIFVINKKYILRNSYALIIGDEFGFITLENINYVTDNFIVSSTDTLLGRNPIYKKDNAGFNSQCVYLLDSFTGGATGKKTKPDRAIYKLNT